MTLEVKVAGGDDKDALESWTKQYGIDPESGKWRFEGINIYMDNRGRFVAQVKGKVQHKPSLIAMKKFISACKKDEFQPFVGLEPPHYGYRMDSHSEKDPFEVVEVKGLKRTGNRTHDLWEFLVETQTWPNRSYKRLVTDTIKNRQLLVKIRDHHAESQRIEEKRQKELEALEEKLVWVTVDDFIGEIPR
jgi:hypothetical protein